MRLISFAVGMTLIELVLHAFASSANLASSWGLADCLRCLAMLAVSCGCVSVAVFCLFRFSNWMVAREGGRGFRIASGMTRLALATTMTGIVAAYLISWSFFFRVGHFLDGEAFEFGARNAAMIGLYLWQSQPVSTVLAILLLIAVFSTVLLFCCRENRAGGEACGPWMKPALPWLMGGGLILGINYVALSHDLAVKQAVESSSEIPYWQRPDGPPVAMTLSHRVDPLLTVMVDYWSHRDGEVEGELSLAELGPPRRAASTAAATLTRRHGDQDSRAQDLSDRMSLPSVIVIAVESLRSDVVGLAPGGIQVMPHLNALADDGLNFTRAYAQSTHSNYADPCVFSSLYPLRTESHHYYSKYDPWPKTLLYDALNKHGYRTAMFSSQNESWGNMEQFLRTDGLDTFFDSQEYDGPTYVSETDKGFARYVRQAKVSGKLDDSVTMGRAIEWVKRQAGDSHPFCLCMNLQSSHFPYPIPEGAAQPFTPANIDFDCSFLNYPEDKVPVVKNAYFNALHYIDLQLGRLLSALEIAGIADETLIVVLGDNGESFYEHGFATHGGPPVDPQVHVALVVHGAGAIEAGAIEAGAVEAGAVEAGAVDYPTEMIDVAPTILGILGLSQSEGWQGRNVLATSRPDPDSRLMFVHCSNGRTKCDAVISATGWKYTRHLRTGKETLRHTGRDPAEAIDFASRNSIVAEILRAKVMEWRRRQLIYHAKPAYYAAWNPPPPPVLNVEETRQLRKSGESASGLGSE